MVLAESLGGEVYKKFCAPSKGKASFLGGKPCPPKGKGFLASGGENAYVKKAGRKCC
jgi:hypothetical protein